MGRKVMHHLQHVERIKTLMFGLSNLYPFCLEAYAAGSESTWESVNRIGWVVEHT